jgi:chemotaxis protein MotB
MRFRRSQSTDQNFWVAYADLMAGLLFVFILLIGAIVVKYVYMQGDLIAIRTDLEAQKRELELSEAELAKKKQDVAKITDKLIAVQLENKELIFTKARLEEALKKANEDINQTQASLDAAKVLLQEQAKSIDEKKEQLRLSQAEVNALKDLLLETKTLRDDAESMALEALEDLKQAKAAIQEQQSQIALKNDEIALLGKKLLDKTLAHQKLVEDLNITRARIQNLTGIRIQVIKALKEKLGDSIDVDENSGAIRLPSQILFETGKYTLRPEAAEQLKKRLLPYLEVLLNDENIRENIDRIVIEGHTDSSGSYMYNLYLSQQRALSVMEEIYKWPGLDRALLQKYLSASGRSFSDLIYDKEGKEDMEASRRIEVKFNISNSKAIKEIQTFLKGDY